MKSKFPKKFKVIAVFLTVLLMPAAVVIAAYKTHTEIDSGLFFKTFPNLLGTKLDGCDVCHVRTTAPPPGEKGKSAVVLSSCDSCHVITDYGGEKGETLNAFGRDYMKAGRDTAAFTAIAELDSDSDTLSNAAELKAGTNPGDPKSLPDMKPAPYVVFSLKDLIEKGVSIKEQTIFVNVTKSKDGDSYSDMRGFLLMDALEAAGVSDSAQSVDVISLDGYETTFSIDQLRRSYKQAVPVFGFDKETFGECGWVRYGSKNLQEGVPLPDANVLMTFEINGEAYAPAKIDENDRLVGAGPFRLVAPQMKNPGSPDISSKATGSCVEKTPEIYRYNKSYEKNSDYCVKAVVAIRVNPMPAGTMDINWSHYAEKADSGNKIVVFGALKR
ncbi:MAG: GEGP motif-containing diheme protein [bacterium]